VDVLSGKDNWDQTLTGGTPPHREIGAAQATPENEKPATENGQVPPSANGSAYKRWKPETNNGGQ
jgi:hypothetical protein